MREEIFNYIPEEYSSNKKRFLELQQEKENLKLGINTMSDLNRALFQDEEEKQ